MSSDFGYVMLHDVIRLYWMTVCYLNMPQQALQETLHWRAPAPYAVTWALHVYKHTSSSVKLFGECDHYKEPQVLWWWWCGDSRGKGSRSALNALRSFVEGPWSPHIVFTVHEVSLWGKIRLGGFLWLRQCSQSLLPGWVSIGLQVHTLARRPPVAPTNCSIHSSAGDGRRPLIGYQRRLGNFPTANACWQPASHSSPPPGHTRGRRGWVWVGAVTDRKSIGPLSKFLQRSSTNRRITPMSYLLRFLRKGARLNWHNAGGNDIDWEWSKISLNMGIIICLYNLTKL